MPARETPGLDVPAQAEFQSAQHIMGARAARPQSVTHQWLQLAEITKVETNEDGRWSGYLTVRLLTVEGTRQRVKYTASAVGNGLFAGECPEEGSLVLLGWLPAGIPIVLAKVPFSVEALYQRKALPELKKGEYLIRGGVVEGGAKVPGGSVRWDQYGRVVLTDKDKRVEVVVGPPRDGNGEVESNDATGQNFRCRVTVKDINGVSAMKLRVDDAGNVSLEAPRLDILADEVNVGDDPGNEDKLVTRRWVQQTFLTHVHPDPTSGVTGTPQGGAGSAFTDVLRSK